jgi:hypothetical protein
MDDASSAVCVSKSMEGKGKWSFRVAESCFISKGYCVWVNRLGHVAHILMLILLGAEVLGESDVCRLSGISYPNIVALLS